VLLALVPGTGHLLFNFAHRFVDVSVSSVVSAGNPIIASLLALLVLGEPLDAVQVAGGIVAVLAIAAVAYQAAGPGAAGALPGRQGEQAVIESDFVAREPCPEPGMEQLRLRLASRAGAGNKNLLPKVRQSISIKSWQGSG